MADTEQKSHGLLDRCRDFLGELEINLPISNRAKIRLFNGSEIHALTANASKGQDTSKAGRSLSFQMLHLSELAFWPDQNAYGALTASAGLSAPVIVESTSSGPGDLMWQLWNGDNSFKKVFFPVESHLAYRIYGVDLSPEKIEEGRALGFSDEAAMAWFFRALEDRFGGDLIKCIREYPQRPEHAFQSAAGRWISTTPPVLEHDLIRGMKVFKKRDHATRYSIGVDTAGGLGMDASTIVVLDKRDGSISATYHDSDATVNILADQVRSAYEMYAPDHVCIEVNGIGLATAQACRDKGVPVYEIKTTEASRYSGLLGTRLAIENGYIAGPIELAEECDVLHIDNRERFAGKKDMCMAIGFAIEDIKRSPLIDRIVKPDGIFDMGKHLSNSSKWKGEF